MQANASAIISDFLYILTIGHPFDGSVVSLKLVKHEYE